MPAQPKHRQPIINAAVTLFRRHGYPGTRLNDIAEASGAPKGSLYHYFPEGKSSIAVAAIEEAGRRVVTTIEELSTQASSTAELLRAHALLLTGWMQKSGFRDGCPITTVLLAMAPMDRRVVDAGRKVYVARCAVLAAKLRTDGFSDRRSESLAVLCTAALQGALIQARVERSGAALRTTADEMAKMIEVTLAAERMTSARLSLASEVSCPEP